MNSHDFTATSNGVIPRSEEAQGATMRVGQLLDLMEEAKPDSPVLFDFCRARPVRLIASRVGSSALAVEPALDPDITTAHDFLRHLWFARGACFRNQNGGHFIVGDKTEVWVDEPGEWTGTAIVEARDYGHLVILSTSGPRASA